MSAGFEHFEAEDGVGVIGRGATLAEAFAETALGVFARMVSLDAVEEHEVREVRAHGDSVESLLVSWLNECLYVYDVEGIVPRRIEFATTDWSRGQGGETHRLHSFLHGEEMDPARHRPRAVVKPVTRRQASVETVEGGYRTRVILAVERSRSPG